MDSVKSLVEKLSEQLRHNEDKSNLIITAQQILTELGGAVIAKPLPQNIYQETPMDSPEEEVVMQAQVTPELAPITNTDQELETSVEVIDENLVPNIVEAHAVENSQVNLAEVKT
jgi:hypothetical protein